MVKWICNSVSRELENPFVWFPILLSIGIIVAFQMGFAISAMPYISLILGLSSFAWRWSKISFVLIFIPVLGVLVTVLRIEAVSSITIKKKLGPTTVIGSVVDVEEISSNSAKLILDDLSIENLAKDSTPSKIRVRVKTNGQDHLLAGDRVKIFAIIMPPPESYYFDGYSFSRYLWFKRIGGSGFALTQPIKLQEGQNSSLWRKLKEGLDNYRLMISRKIREVLGDDIGSLAGALITGHTKIIPKSTQDAFRNSGLTHLLVISGFNISLLTLFIIFSVRSLLSFFPAYANRFDSTKIASVFGILGALFYCLISGASIPTVRAFLVVLLVFLAILFRRNPFTMNTAAAAAFIILLLTPESIFSLSFQLSFAAVVALIGGYEFLRSQEIIGRVIAWVNQSRFWLILAANYVSGVFLATVIATLATSVITVYHFHKIISFSIFANVLAVPISAFWITPLTLVFLFLMPFQHLSEWVLYLLAPAFQLMKNIAVFFSSLDGSVIPIVGSNSIYFTLAVSGGILFLICRSGIRYLGIPLLLAGFLSIYLHKLPIIHINKDGYMVAFVDDRKLFVRTQNKRKGRFLRKKWMELHGAEEEIFLKYNTFNLGRGRKVTVDWNADDKSCSHSSRKEILIAPNLTCSHENNPFLITQDTLGNLGNVSIFWDEETPILRGTRKGRPWN